MTDTVHPIEEESYRILRDRIDLSGWAEGPAALAARVIHATADPGLLDHLVVPEEAVRAGVAALAAHSPVICDIEMVRAAITSVSSVCSLGEVVDAGRYPSRSAAAMATAAAAHPDGAIFVIGCAPTALDELNALVESGRVRPALVIGTPVGYVGAAAAKERLLEVAEAHGVPAVTLRGERGGAAVAAALTNALVRLAGMRPAEGAQPASVLLIGHGTRSNHGAEELRGFADALHRARPAIGVEAGFIEFVEPALDEALDRLVGAGARHVVGLPLLLLGAGHLKDDGPDALARARTRHPGVSFRYARDLGVHPLVLATVEERIRAVDLGPDWPAGPSDAVVVVARGSTDPDANADLAKATRLLADGRGLATGLFDTLPSGAVTPPLGLVEPAFVSLARPSLEDALDRCQALGARRIAVVPYFLFTGVLVERIAELTARWGAAHPDTAVAVGRHMGIDDRLVELAWARYDEALGGPVQMNCDGCLYRVALPGYEHRVGTPRP